MSLSARRHAEEFARQIQELGYERAETFQMAFEEQRGPFFEPTLQSEDENSPKVV
jgi:hypothetical protein